MGEHHHHHRSSVSPEERREIKIYKIIARTLFLLAFGAFIPYFAMEFMPFVRSIYAHHKINMTTMCYTALRIMLVFVPLILVIPEKLYKKYVSFNKPDLLSRYFAVLSFFFFSGLVVDIMTYNVFANYEDVGADPIMLKMLWGEIGISGLLFCFFQSAGYFALWKKIKGHRKEIIIIFSGTYALYLICPVLTGLISGDIFVSSARQIWFDKNVWFFISDAFVIAGLLVAARKRRVWGELIWS